MTHHSVVGIDISKARLDAHRLPAGETLQFPNSPSGLQKLRRWLRAAAPVELVVYEPTGHWHRALEEMLLTDGLAAAPVNPLQARRFAQALGQRAKTDRVDARMLAGMGVTHGAELRRAAALTPTQRELQALQVQRDTLVTEHTAVRQRQQRPQPALVRRQLRGQQRLLERQTAALDATAWDLIRGDAGLARKAEILLSIPSVGPVTTAVLLAFLPELGRLSGRAAASLTGVAPYVRESGTWKGRRRIQSGRGRVRKGLYMAAVCAMRGNPELQQLYERLTARGKPGKVALVAVMRKLVVLANVLIRDDRLWTPPAP